MNIFELFGLPEDHRKHPFQLVKHLDEVPVSKISFPVYGQVKRDGVFAAAVCTGEQCHIFNRTGKKMTNVEGLESRYANFPRGIYLGELQTLAIDAYLEGLSGIVNPNRVEPLNDFQQQMKDMLYIDFFDMLTFKAFVDGYTSVTFCQRHDALVRRLKHLLQLLDDNILPITQLNSFEEVHEYAETHIKAGREGAVFKHDCDYESGHKGWRQFKIVRGVNYDLLCVDWEEGSGKYKGKVANLIFKWKGGKTVKAMLGRGWTHDDARHMFLEIQLGHSTPVGKIFAVKALQESSKGVLRLPKAGECRHDKESPDV